jgi:hypothetical protein
VEVRTTVQGESHLKVVLEDRMSVRTAKALTLAGPEGKEGRREEIE